MIDNYQVNNKDDTKIDSLDMSYLNTYKYFGIYKFSDMKCTEEILNNIIDTNKILPDNADEKHKIKYLYNDIKKTNWLDFKKRDDYFMEILDTITKYVNSIIGENPETHYANWFESIQNHCFQGGFGHSIICTPPLIGKYSCKEYGSIYSPHHWCVRPEYFNQVRLIPHSVLLSALITDKHIYIAPVARVEVWGN
jgi:hypothetical protein